MKRVLAICMGLMLFSSVALASPLMDFSQGKTSIDLNWRNAKINTGMSGDSMDWPKKSNFDGGVTFGLGNKFAVQYRNFAPESGDYSDSGETYRVESKYNEFNVLYKLDQNVAAFAGFVNTGGTLKRINPLAASRDLKSRNLWQIGVVGSTAIADKTTLWGSVGVGSDLTSWEIGVGYEFAPNFEFNVNYRETEAKKMKFDNLPFEFDIKSKGLGFGITYKF